MGDKKTNEQAKPDEMEEEEEEEEEGEEIDIDDMEEGRKLRDEYGRKRVALGRTVAELRTLLPHKFVPNLPPEKSIS